MCSLVTVLLTLHRLELHLTTSLLVLKEKDQLRLCLDSNGLPWLTWDLLLLERSWLLLSRSLDLWLNKLKVETNQELPLLLDVLFCAVFPAFNPGLIILIILLLLSCLYLVIHFALLPGMVSWSTSNTALNSISLKILVDSSFSWESFSSLVSTPSFSTDLPKLVTQVELTLLSQSSPLVFYPSFSVWLP